ncbi:MAG: hypothetical protein QG661_2163 [Actinomycetota bacterium]|nr:hypothetical protein [Actinomycetota bacterium]
MRQTPAYCIDGRPACWTFLSPSRRLDDPERPFALAVACLPVPLESV